MSLVRKNIIALQKAEKRLEKIAQNAVRDNMEAILTILKEEQLHEGIMSSGKSAPYYNPSTIDFARANPPRTGVNSKSSSNRWNYDWSGSWIESMYIKMEKDGFSILSRDGKTAMLEKMSGGKLTALTKENNDLINDEIIKPALFEFMLDNLLNF